MQLYFLAIDRLDTEKGIISFAYFLDYKREFEKDTIDATIKKYKRVATAIFSFLAGWHH